MTIPSPRLDAKSPRAQCRGVTPEEAIAEAAAGKLRPVYLVLGEERLLVDRAVQALRDAAGKGGIAGFNEDKFTAGEAQIGAILGACKMLPMMAPRRFVLVRGLDRWEKKEADDDAPPKPTARGRRRGPSRARSTSSPTTPRTRRSTTVLVLVSPKLHGQRRLVTAAKKGGFLVSCEPLSREALPGGSRRPRARRATPSPPRWPTCSPRLPARSSATSTTRSSASRSTSAPAPPSPRTPSPRP